jgi:integrase
MGVEIRTRPSPTAPRLLDQVRERARYLHYSLRTEKAYLYWVRLFVRWHGMRHPRDMGSAQVESFLTMLATQRHVSSSTHNQALSALLFLYKEVLGVDLPWLNGLQRPAYTRRIPTVLTRDQVGALLSAMDGTIALVARLLYGTGMRLMEGLRLRVKDIDFDRKVIIVREAKGNKDRVGCCRLLSLARLRLRSPWRGCFGLRIVRHSTLASRYRMPWRRSMRRLAKAGDGSGCSPHRPWHRIRAPQSCEGTISMRSAFNAPSKRPFPKQEFTSASRPTHCATALPPIFYSRGLTSALSRSSWGTAT